MDGFGAEAYANYSNQAAQLRSQAAGGATELAESGENGTADMQTAQSEMKLQQAAGIAQQKANLVKDIVKDGAGGGVPLLMMLHHLDKHGSI